MVHPGDDKKVDIDCDGRSREEIFNHIKTLFGTKKSVPKTNPTEPGVEY